jgi:hypothetical protein
MPIKVVVEFQAKPGARAGFKQVPGFLWSTVYEVVDSPDGLVEVAEWDSREAHVAAVQQAMADGVRAPVVELVAAPFRATRIGLS